MKKEKMPKEVKWDYLALKELSTEKVCLPLLIKFLGCLDNSRLRPSDLASGEDLNLPPMLIWWYKKDDPEAHQLIVDAFNNYPWKDEWILETRRGKWGLYPRRVKQVEMKLRNAASEEEVGITRDAFWWLDQHEPEFGQRTNREFREFTKYFRKIVEDYLYKKEYGEKEK